MEVILIVIVGALVLIMSIVALFRSLLYRIKAPNNRLNDEIAELKKRVSDLEVTMKKK